MRPGRELPRRCAHVRLLCWRETLTAGRAKKEIPSRAKPAESSLPVQVCGVLSPYPMVVRVIWNAWVEERCQVYRHTQ